MRYSYSSMWRKEKSYDKWTQPGWRIEQKYANRVLIGNWVENRLQVGCIFVANENVTTHCSWV